ncbi:MAG: ATP-dependent helicase RecG, partial [Solirubrobacteraceae bacterium]|nr:ATP-dependent helicase RecG [Solirubrobacteraceae bacterium]
MEEARLPTRFAAAEPLERGRLDAAPARFPRPSALEARVELDNPKAAEGAAALGLGTVGDLLEHLPRDRREARTVDALQRGETATVVVEVRSIASRPVRRRGMRPLVEATVADGSGPMKVTFFNQPWLVGRYPPGTRLVLHGKYEGRNRFRVSDHAPTAEATGGSGAVAHYPAAEGISSTQIHALIDRHRDSLHDVLEPLPARLRAAEALPDRPAALAAAHFPDAPGDGTGAHRRLAFDELLLLQLALLRRRVRRIATSAAASLNEPRQLTARWLAGGLPFTLTADQAQAVAEIERDLADERPMQRLLMGEVGSGKTVVALFGMLRAVEHGGQAALMAPTETLAEQHFATLQRLMAHEAVPAALLTGSTPAARRRDVLGKLASGELSLIVGTHALIEEDVAFADLVLAVVDEQHRFGVRQRTALERKARPGLLPHLLHMTATPIPRTLRLTTFGDLDVTELKELPSGRRPISTYVASSDAERSRAYERIREELRAGRQAFVVCPLVEESEALQARAATAEFERLRKSELEGFQVVLMH